MNLYFTLASYAIAASIGFGAAWNWQGANITQIELEAANDRIASQRAARVEAERRVAAVAAAQNSAQTRLRAVVADRGRADLVGNGLRITTAETVRTAAENPAACPAVSTACRDVFIESISFIQTMAEDADRCFIDLKQLEDSWPK